VASALLVLPVVAVVAWYVAVIGTGKLPFQLVRLALECALAVFVYRGATWARRLAIGLFAVGALGSLVVLAPALIVLGSTFVVAIRLLVDKETVAHLDRKQDRRLAE
jgi:hypothetical protein